MYDFDEAQYLLYNYLMFRRGLGVRQKYVYKKQLVNKWQMIKNITRFENRSLFFLFARKCGGTIKIAFKGLSHQIPIWNIRTYCEVKERYGRKKRVTSCNVLFIPTFEKKHSDIKIDELLCIRNKPMLNSSLSFLCVAQMGKKKQLFLDVVFCPPADLMGREITIRAVIRD